MRPARPPLLRSAWLALLALLLGLGPFIHGHLRQPLVEGWHLHAPVSAFAHGHPPVQQSGKRSTDLASATLQQTESADVDVAPGIATPRLQRVASATAANGGQPFLPVTIGLDAAARSATAAATGMAKGDSPPPHSGDYGLTPPAQAPPSSVRA